MWEIVNEEREEDADRVRQGGWEGGLGFGGGGGIKKGRKKTPKTNMEQC